MNPNDAEMVVLGIGGAVLIAGLLPAAPDGSEPLTIKLALIGLAVLIGIIFLAVAIYDMLAN